MLFAMTRDGTLGAAGQLSMMSDHVKQSFACPSCTSPMALVIPRSGIFPHFRSIAAHPHATNCPEQVGKSLILESSEIASDSARAALICVTSKITLRVIEYFAEHPQRLKTLDRRLFEEFVAELFRGFGYDVELTKQTRDGGFDLIAVTDRDFISQRFIIECKRPEPGNPVRLNVVKNLYATKHDQVANKAILVSTTHFTKDALQFGARHRHELDLKDFDDLVKWLFHYIKIKAAQG